MKSGSICRRCRAGLKKQQWARWLQRRRLAARMQGHLHNCIKRRACEVHWRMRAAELSAFAKIEPYDRRDVCDAMTARPYAPVAHSKDTNRPSCLALIFKRRCLFKQEFFMRVA